ncbi:DUF346 domain-containing protein [Virgibacillus phasianinus]|uniref:DUF346 domain-containing protein n=1 Tax=Virgibacillus phasianinus TaxID=2017483 RepID=UPI001FE4A950|nr:DUF346 domain-containing protein [Virgibacillus phasianinus]
MNRNINHADPFIPIENYNQANWDTRQQPSVQEIMQTIRSEHGNLYSQLERAGMNRYIVDYVFSLIVSFAINQANTNQSANQIYNRFQSQVPWVNLLFGQFNVPQSLADRVLVNIIQIVLNAISGGGSGQPQPGQGWSAWENLGGTLTSSPAVASWQSNRLDVFGRGTGQNLYHKWWDGNRWSGWENLGGTLTSAPAAVSWGPNRIDVFTRGTDQSLYHKWWDGNRWSDWENLGGSLTSAPAVSSRRSNQLDVFVRGTNQRLYMRTWNGSRWGDWQDLGGSLSSGPAAVSWGQIELMYSPEGKTRI